MSNSDIFLGGKVSYLCVNPARMAASLQFKSMVYSRQNISCLSVNTIKYPIL